MHPKEHLGQDLCHHDMGARSWGLAFWSYECGEAACNCFREYPPSWSLRWSDEVDRKTEWGSLQNELRIDLELISSPLKGDQA